MRASLQRLTAPPAQTLRTLQPTPSTASYIVSTRPKSKTIPTKIAIYVGLVIRIIVGLATALLIWTKCRVETASTEYILLCTLGHLRTQQLLIIADTCQWRYLAPSALVIFVLVFRRNYTGTLLSLLLLYHTLACHLHCNRRVSNSPSWPRYTNLHHIRDVPTKAHDALHTHDKHTRYFHTRSVQGIRGQVLFNYRG